MLDYSRFKDIDELFLRGRHDEARHLLMEMQSRYIAVCDENSALRMQVHEYEDILYLSRNLVFDGACYWLVTGDIKQGPFCRHCYNRSGALIRLDDAAGADGTVHGRWRCVCCGTPHERDYAVAVSPAMTLPAPRPATIIPFPQSLRSNAHDKNG
ncbi:MAG: hypothetical protein J1E80_05340 [Desulfovibrionaceae bacterium]|nr:hypothetical protein [Desulfovibrionaceae bacterium]